MDNDSSATEEKLRLVREAFGPDKCQSMNAFVCGLIISAIDAKTKELVISHDFRGMLKRQGDKEEVKNDLRIYEELKGQIKALADRGDV